MSRVSISNGFAAAGVFLLISATLSPATWYPAAQLFTGLACLVVSHVLTPCQDQITRWWNERISRLWRRKGTDTWR